MWSHGAHPVFVEWNPALRGTHTMCFLEDDVRPESCGDLAVSPQKPMRQVIKKSHYTNGPCNKMLDLI